MPTVDLFTRDGQFVETVPFMPYKTPPDAILWGLRYFIRREDGKYYEGFVHYVTPGVHMNGYTEEIPNYGDLMTVKDFRETCECGGFIDYDGSGHPVKDGKMMGTLNVVPSKLDKIPADATHVVWFNR